MKPVDHGSHCFSLDLQNEPILNRNSTTGLTGKSEEHIVYHWRIKKGGRGPDPPKNHKNIGYPSNIDPDPLKVIKLPSQHSMVGHYRHASKTPFQWRFAGRQTMAHFFWHFDLLSIPSKKKSVLDPL